MRYLQSVVVSFLFLMTLGADNVPAIAPADAHQVLDAYSKSQGWIQNMAMKCETESKIEGHLVPEAVSHEIVRFNYRRTDGFLEWVGTREILAPPRDKSLPTWYRFQVIEKPGLAIEFDTPIDEPPRYVLSMASLGPRRDYLLSIERYQGSLDGRPSGFSDKPLTQAFVECADLRISSRDDRVGDEICYKLEGTSPYGKISAWFVPDKNFALVKYVLEQSGTDVFETLQQKRIPISEFELGKSPGLKGKSRAAILENVKIEQVGDKFVPVYGEYMTTLRTVNGHEMISQHRFRRSDIQFNPDFEAMGAFKIDLPDGTPIFNAEAPENTGVKYEWREGKVVPAIDRKAIEKIDKSVDQIRETK